jgi:hypothetical protein
MPIVAEFSPHVQENIKIGKGCAGPNPEVCPGCSQDGQMIGHGHYLRKAKGVGQCWLVQVKRWKCKDCGLTVGGTELLAVFSALFAGNDPNCCGGAVGVGVFVGYDGVVVQRKTTLYQGRAVVRLTSNPVSNVWLGGHRTRIVINCWEGLKIERMSKMSSSRDDKGKPKASDRGTAEQTNSVKPVGVEQWVKPSPA